MDDEQKIAATTGSAIGISAFASFVGLCCIGPWAVVLFGVSGAVTGQGQTDEDVGGHGNVPRIPGQGRPVGGRLFKAVVAVDVVAETLDSEPDRLITGDVLLYAVQTTGSALGIDVEGPATLEQYASITGVEQIDVGRFPCLRLADHHSGLG